MPKWPVTIWLCPTCGNYYGASSAGNLDEEVNKNKRGEVWPRSRCPQCGDMRCRCDVELELVPKPDELNAA